MLSLRLRTVSQICITLALTVHCLCLSGLADVSVATSCGADLRSLAVHRKLATIGWVLPCDWRQTLRPTLILFYAQTGCTLTCIVCNERRKTFVALSCDLHNGAPLVVFWHAHCNDRIMAGNSNFRQVPVSQISSYLRSHRARGAIVVLVNPPTSQLSVRASLTIKGRCGQA